jgi:hypothetical protein
MLDLFPLCFSQRMCLPPHLYPMFWGLIDPLAIKKLKIKKKSIVLLSFLKPRPVDIQNRPHKVTHSPHVVQSKRNTVKESDCPGSFQRTF